MKKSILLFSSCLLVFGLMCPLTLHADDHPSRMQKKSMPDITTIVTDLTPAQKKKIEQTSKESHERIQLLKDQLSKVRDSIRMYMDDYKDNSKVLNPLFEREGNLEVAINKEKYSTKTSINKLLTPEQHKQLINYFEKKNNRKCDGNHEKCMGNHEKCSGKHEKQIKKQDKTLSEPKSVKKLKVSR